MNITTLSASSTDSGAQTALPVKTTDALSDKTTFLKLLVSQIKNQNPLNPQDGTQFLAQLAQFSQVEQLVNIRQDLDDIKAASLKNPSTATVGNSAP